ncbi:hypothetical protein TTHERM_00437350 (macronuclear) [Tetrahymena thermophila SB210]|uniref:Transmembrane protein n=1 Tax=Tetrahymena thermophila (strain SB210) TaxID=312017 RepID=I7MES1_TETTS|nr:hypothetical protein TTHERM_00437350 [Tetrahymena thermophila SB210]EAR97486.1 hypothetical protein TTHERM_00437350 [Tetrahymena thermophila SB210]|eukprot:XP_001017731.1 hypothetical protein TTHERM_00437350 [Tetrahymena thermophila SB210]
MQKQFIIALLLIIAVTSKPDLLQGNLLRCLGQIGKTVKQVTDLLATIQEKKDKAKILRAVGQIAGQIQPLMEECSNPMCLFEAQLRCEKSTGKSCEQYGAIMYPKCDNGFFNVGCCLCASQCPPGFRDDGFFCAKPSAYGRGAGYPWQFGDAFNLDNATKRCEKDNSQGCEQNGLIIYPKCQQGFHNFGCCICSPDCPSGTVDIGVSCTKPVYGRGVGFPMYYDDCSNKKLLRASSENYESYNIEELEEKMLQKSETFIQNQHDIDEAVKIAIELQKVTSAFEIKASEQQQNK